jgi:DNA replication licensing factor MCM3
VYLSCSIYDFTHTHVSKNKMEEFDGSVKKFLLDFNNSSKYVDKIMECIQDGKFRLIVNVDDLRGYLDSKDFAKMMERPRELMMSIQRMAKDVALSEDATIEKLLENQEIQCGFEGSFGYNAISPRGLRSDLLNQIVDVEGIVTKCSNVRPKLVRTVHYCPKSDEYTKREFKDQLSIDIGINIDGKRSFPSTSVIPSVDGAGNELEMEYGFCKYKDYQTIVVQEMPERARVGQLPRSIQVVIEDDLVDKVKPGDRIKVVGVYRPISEITGQSGAAVNALFKTVLMCNNIQVIGKEVGGVQVLPGDIDNFRDVCDRHDILDIMGKSLCPSIFGHDFIKKALILQLLGGCEKNLDNGTHIRGDINMLMVGDPSTAKSQLLRSIIDIADLAISTTGRGSSGVGLTAAVTSDSETGERRLEVLIQYILVLLLYLLC